MSEQDTIAMLRYRLACADAHIARLEEIIALCEAGVAPAEAQRVAEIIREELAGVNLAPLDTVPPGIAGAFTREELQL